MQLRRWRVNQVTMNLALVTLANKTEAISLHCKPIIPCPQNLLRQNISIHVRSAYPRMHFTHDPLSFCGIYASQQVQIWGPFVQNFPIQEETVGEPPYSSFLISLGMLWVFSCFQESFYVMIPWFTIWFCLNCIAVTVLISNLDF